MQNRMKVNPTKRYSMVLGNCKSDFKKTFQPLKTTEARLFFCIATIVAKCTIIAVRKMRKKWRKLMRELNYILAPTKVSHRIVSKPKLMVNLA